MVIFGLLGLNKNVRKIFKRKKMVMGWHGSRMTSQEVGMFIEWRDLAWPHGTVHLGCSGGGDGRDEDGHRGRSQDDEVPATWGPLQLWDSAEGTEPVFVQPLARTVVWKQGGGARPSGGQGKLPKKPAGKWKGLKAPPPDFPMAPPKSAC